MHSENSPSEVTMFAISIGNSLITRDVDSISELIETIKNTEYIRLQISYSL